MFIHNGGVFFRRVDTHFTYHFNEYTPPKSFSVDFNRFK